MKEFHLIEVECPQCSPDEPVTHSVIKESTGLTKCEECGFVHIVPMKKEKQIKIKVIVSRQDRSSVHEVEFGEEDVIREGDEFVVDTGEEVSGVRVQSIENKRGGRTEVEKATDILAIWARTIDEVIVKIAVQKRETTESIDYKVHGDYEFIVGDTMRVKGYEVKISGIKVRDGGHFKRPGTTIKAKDIKRIYSKIIGESKISPRERGSGLRSRPMGMYRGRRDNAA